MNIGILKLELEIPWCESLKKKRALIKPLIIRLHKEFNISVSESGKNDSLRSSTISCVEISSDRIYIEKNFSKIIAFLQTNFSDIDILAHSTEYFF